ncbi:MAG: methyltransferase domain-containing protein [Planctomycetota bacterium]|nr:methyltransferase domain-containing protein [Planctomycetota bacterium]
MTQTQTRRPTSKTGIKITGRGAYIRQFLANPFVVGSVAPSSPQLGEEMLRGLNLGSARAVLEIGPGTGCFTDMILPRLGANTRFIAIELNEDMARGFRRRLPQVTLVNESAEHAPSICARYGIDKVDHVISGLPWASFPDDLQERLLGAIQTVLKPGGTFVTFGYHIGTLLKNGKLFYSKLPGRFENVHRSRIVWRNVPPAFVVRGTQPGG